MPIFVSVNCAVESPKDLRFLVDAQTAIQKAAREFGGNVKSVRTAPDGCSREVQVMFSEDGEPLSRFQSTATRTLDRMPGIVRNGSSLAFVP